MKFLVVLFLLSCIYLDHCACNKTLSHNVSWGARSIYDIHLVREVVYQESRFLRKISEDYVYEQKNVGIPKTITMVSVTDQYTNGKGGYATLTSGGPSYHFVKLRLNSQRGRGFNFIINIYGR